MTLEELVESICTSINDYKVTTKERVRRLIPVSVNHILAKNQWEFAIKVKENLTTVANQAWVNCPDDFDKEIALWRTDYEKRIEYITPQQYADKLAVDATPYGEECVRYTVMGGERLKQRRIYFLDNPTSAITIKLIYSKTIDPLAIQALPDEFLEVIKSHIVYRMTPPWVVVNGIRQSNPSFIVTRDDYRSNLSELISRQQGQRGRLKIMRLHPSLRNANQYLHK